MLHTHRESNVTFLKAPILDAVPGLVHAFSTRRTGDGDLSLGGEGPRIRENRDRFMAAVGLEAWPEAQLRQIHSNIVHWIGDNMNLNESLEGDGVGTSLEGVALGVRTADCVPILFAERSGRAVAAAHAGWRGTSEGIVRKTIERLVAEEGVDAVDLMVAIGPHIGVCCMEVGEEVVDWFAQPEVFERRADWPRPHLDLAAANRAQLIASGIPAEQIQTSGLCTRCHAGLFHSYRRDGEDAGRMLSLIGLRP